MLICCSFLFWLLVTIYLSCKNLSFVHLGTLFAYLEALMWNLLFLDNVDITIPTINGEIIRKSGEVVYIPLVNNTIKDTFKVLLQNSVISLYLTFVFAIGISWFLKIRGEKKSNTDIIRGSKLEEFKKVKKNILNHSNGLKAYTIANMPYPHYSEMEHTIIMGSTGVGKTVLISDLVEQIRKRKDKAIIYDKKGDYVSWFYNKKKDIILNPFDKRGVKWNLLAEIQHIGQLKTLSKAFIANKSIYSESSQIWDEAARIAFSAILEKLIINGEDLSNQEIVDLILRQDIKEVAKLVKGTYAQSTIDLSSPKTAASVLFVLATHFNSLRVTTGKKNESFSIKRWLQEKNRDSILFISSQQDLSAELSPLITAWFEIAIAGILSLDQNLNKKTWIILDELPTIQKIPSLSQGLSITRSYGGCFVLGMQNIAQMKEIYGKNLVEDISSECNTRCIFKTNDPETSYWMSKNIGEAEMKEHKEGVSYGAHAIRDGVNIQDQNKITSVILPSEIQNMKKFNLLLK